ncbi:MAG: FAD:protein FMN transferase [Elusimicrobia bacterium]|nr:FAD:protein FMN transferase [Elusimicrobiota bacterium]
MKFFLLFFSFLFASCGGEKFATKRFFYFGTYIDVTLPAKTDGEVFDKIENEIKRCDNLLNIKTGLAAELNRKGSLKNRELGNLIEVCREANRNTNGLFDLTVEPVLKLWGFSPESETKKVPTEKELADALQEEGMGKIKIRNGEIFTNGATLNFGGVGKGYLLSRIEIILKKEKIENALIDAGGDILAIGKRGRKAWKIGVKNPTGSGILCILSLSNLSVSTSGDYENFFETKGKKYSHIINPKTGKTAQEHQVTVISPDPVVADIYSTAFMLMKPEKAVELADKMKMGVLIVNKSGKIFKNKIFQSSSSL